MGIIETVLEKKFSDGKPFWIAVIEGKEIPCYDPSIKDYKGKENPFEIATSAAGKQFLKVPKAGGFQGKSGGGWKGKSDKELYLQALTMSMAYAKDVYIGVEKEIDLIAIYKRISQAILADLKILCPDVPVVDTKAPDKTPVVPRDKEYSGYQAPAPAEDFHKTTMGEMTIKEKLSFEMHKYLKGMNSDTEDSFKTLLMDISGFPGKDRDTGELTGKMVCIDDINDKKFSDKWALTSYGKLKKLKEEQEIQEHHTKNVDDDIPY